MKGKISKIKNTKGELALPVTTVEAVYSEDGKTLNDEIKNINSSLDNLESKVNELREGNIDIDLTNYVTKSELSSKADKTELHSHSNKDALDGITTNKITEWDNKSNFSGNYNDLTNKPTIPTKVSELTNDEGYLTEYQDVYWDVIIGKPTTFEPSSHNHSINDISDYPNDLATKDYVEEAINNAKLEGGDTQVDLSIYAKKTDLHDHSNKTILDNITASKVNQWDNKSNFSGNYNDLTNKPTIPTKVSELTNDASYLTSIPDDYVTDSELNNKGYLTEHQDISGKVDKVNGKSLISDSEIERLSTLKNYDDTDIKNTLNSKADKTDLHSHTNKTVLDGITSAKVNEWNNKSAFDGNYNNLTNKPNIPTRTSQLTNDSGFITTVPSEYITETELNAKGYLTQHQDISHKVDKINGYSLVSDVEISRLATLENYNDTEIRESINEIDASLDNIMNKLDEGKSTGSINVSEFGAVGDGITDDTQAIQRALDASYEQNKVLKFEAKHYKITGTLYLNDKLCWEGTNRIKNIWSPIDNCETHFDIYFNSTFKELFKAKSTVSADWGLIPTLPMVRVSIRNIGFINKGDNTLEMRDTILFEGMALHHFTLEDSYTFRIGTVIHGALCLLSTIRNNVFMEIERTFIRSDNFEEAWGSTYRVSINDSYIEHNYFSGSPRFTDIKMFDLFYPGLCWIQNNFIEFCYIAFDINTPAYATNINNNVFDYIFLGFTSTQGGFSANIDNNTFSHCTKELFRNHYPTEEIIERVNEDKMETENWKALHVPQGSLTNTTFKNNRFAGCDMGISFKDCWSLDNFICKGNTAAPADNQTNFIFTDFMETGIYHYLDTPLNAYIEECDGLTVDDLPSPILVKSGEGSTLYSFDKQILYVNGDKYQNINGTWNKLNSTKIPLNVIGNFYNSWEFGDVTDITRSAYSCSYNAPQESMMVGHYNVHDLYKGKTYKIGYSDAVNCDLVVYNSTHPEFPVITGSGQQEATVTFPSDLTQLDIAIVNKDIGKVSIKGVYMNEV